MGEHIDRCCGSLTPWFYVVYRLAQFALGLTVCGLYGVDLTNAAAQKKEADPKWTYAVVVASLAVFTALLYLVLYGLERRHAKELFTYHRSTPRFPMYPFWDFILFILFLVVFGLFAAMFIGEDPEGDSGIARMKTAIYVVAACWVLWLGSATLVALVWWRSGGRVVMPLRGHRSSLWVRRESI